MSEQNKDASISSGWYLLSGVVIGAVAGLLLAPKKGSETVEDIKQWRLRARAKAANAFARIGSALPSRVKAAAAVGAVKGGAGEAFDETRDGAKHLIGS
jgi:hypothetical protein